MKLCLLPVSVRLLTKAEQTSALKYLAHTDNASPAATAEVIDGLLTPLHKPIIANLDTAHLQPFCHLDLTLVMPVFLNEFAIEDSNV